VSALRACVDQRGMWCPFVKDLYRLVTVCVEQTDLLVEVLSTLGNIPFDETPRGFTLLSLVSDSGMVFVLPAAAAAAAAAVESVCVRVSSFGCCVPWLCLGYCRGCELHPAHLARWRGGG
jgi:hypothetical protein